MFPDGELNFTYHELSMLPVCTALKRLHRTGRTFTDCLDLLLNDKTSRDEARLKDSTLWFLLLCVLFALYHTYVPVFILGNMQLKCTFSQLLMMESQKSHSR